MRLGFNSGGRGFALIDAAIAVLVVSVGMMVIATTQLKLARNVDSARQRVEATKLAQQKIEDLRAYTAITPGSSLVAWNDMSSGSDLLSTNTQYTRSWTIGGSTTDPMRSVNLSLSWTDRSGQAQQLSLNSVISRSDPADVGALGFPLPANTTLKRPKNRNLNIPVPAVDLGNGQSVIQLSNSFAVVFSNDSGYVVKTCAFSVSTASQLSGCTTATAYVIAGYVSMSGNAGFPTGLYMNTAVLSGTSSTTCVLSNAVDQTTGAAIGGYKYYLCVVAVPASGAAWSGQMRLGAMASGTNYVVCRFQFAAQSGISANQRNVQPYSSVSSSLDNQNYIITTASSCPTVSSLATLQHQNCRSSNPNRSIDCPS